MCSGFEDCNIFYVEATGELAHIGKFLWSPADVPWATMTKIKKGDCIIHYITEKAGGKEFVGVSKAADSAKTIDRAQSQVRFMEIGGDLNYIQEWLSKYEKFYFIPLEGFYRFKKSVKLDEAISMLGVNPYEVIPQNYIRRVELGRKILEIACGISYMPSLSSALERFVALLMLAGKNVLLVGAPGVGKTELALKAARFFTNCEPEVEAGREDLSYDDLIARYIATKDGKLERRLGSLARAVERSWESLETGGGPCHFVLDEINRANIDVALGRFFTVLDVEHRPYVKVLEDIDVKRPYVPLSFRVFATMNVIDRGQLFKLSFALLRRFAYVYVLPPHRRSTPSSPPRLKAEDRNAYLSYAERAYRGLDMKGYLDQDVATILRLPLPQPRDIVDKADELGLLGILDWALGIADELGLEIGPSMILDVLKTTAVYVAAPDSLKPEEGAFVDLVVSSLILPYFASIAPRIRQKAILSARPPREVETIREIVSQIEKWFGRSSTSYIVASSFLYEVPAEV